jgi:hypothetical protein
MSRKRNKDEAELPDHGRPGRVGSDPDSECGWFDIPIENFVVTNDSGNFLFGKGEFQFIQWRNRSTIDQNEIRPATTTRNAFFLVNPASYQIIFFKPKYNDIWESDLANNKQRFNIKAMEVLLQLKSFGIMPVGPFLVSMDTPIIPQSNPELISRPIWHRDDLTTIFMPDAFDLLLRDTGVFNFHAHQSGARVSDYTMIGYTSECVSTAIQLRGEHKCNHIRYRSHPGTVVCIDNVNLQHSSPSVIPTENFDDVDRRTGNDMLLRGIQEPNKTLFNWFFPCQGTTRNLYRTQIRSISPEAVLDIMKQIGSIGIEIMSISFDEDFNQLSVKPFQRFTISEYLKSKRAKFSELGGSIKRKITRKSMIKTKRMKRKKQTKTKRRVKNASNRK